MTEETEKFSLEIQKALLDRARYWVRRDGSIGMSFGDPTKAPHEQFDFNGSESLANAIVTACKVWAQKVAA